MTVVSYFVNCRFEKDGKIQHESFEFELLKRGPEETFFRSLELWLKWVTGRGGDLVRKAS